MIAGVVAPEVVVLFSMARVLYDSAVGAQCPFRQAKNRVVFQDYALFSAPDGSGELGFWVEHIA